MHQTIMPTLPGGISQVEKQGWEEPKQPAWCQYIYQILENLNYLEVLRQNSEEEVIA